MHDSGIFDEILKSKVVKETIYQMKNGQKSEDSIVIWTPDPLSTRPCHYSFCYGNFVFSGF